MYCTIVHMKIAGHQIPFCNSYYVFTEGVFDDNHIEVRREMLRQKKKDSTDMNAQTFYTSHKDRVHELKDLLEKKYPRVPEAEKLQSLKKFKRKVLTVGNMSPCRQCHGN